MKQTRWKCEQCGIGFDREKCGNRPIRFCGNDCYHAWAKANKAYRGTFPKGGKPWNRGVKGIHLSPATEFRKGQESNRKMPVGAVVVRQRKNRNEGARRFIKLAEPNKWGLYAVYLWESAHGPVPKGCVVHHRDHDSLNDTLDNLAVLTRAAHMQEHRDELNAGKK